MLHPVMNTFMPLSFHLNSLTHLTLGLLNLYVLLAIFPVTSALQNISISSNDPSIDYQPSQGVWNSIGDSSATNGAFRLARTEDGVALITRNFRSLHFASPLWPFPIHVRISIDDITQIIDLQDYSVPASKAPPTGLEHASQPSQVRWSFYNVDQERTVKLSAADSSDSGWVAIVDMLIFEVAEPGDSPVIIASPPPPTNLSSPPATGSGDTGSDGTDFNASAPPTLPDLATLIYTATNPLITGVDDSFPLSSGSNSIEDHEAVKRNRQQKLIVMSCSVSASILLLVVGGAIMWGLKKQRDKKRESAKINEGRWRYGGGSIGDGDEKGYEKTTADMEKSVPQMVETFGPYNLPQRISKVYMSPSVPNFAEAPAPAQTTPKSPGMHSPPKTFLDSYIHPQYTPNSSDDASFSTFSATSRDSHGMNDAMLGLGAMYSVEQGVGAYGTARRRGDVGHVGHGSTSSMSSLASNDSSSFLLASRASHQVRDSDSRFSGNRGNNREDARESTGTVIAGITISPPSRSTSNTVTPSSEFGSVQWHEVVDGFPTPPGSARIVCHKESMALVEDDRNLERAGVIGTGDGRRESCWSESFPFPIPRIPLPGLPYIPHSAPATRVAFDTSERLATSSHSRSKPMNQTPAFRPLRPLPLRPLPIKPSSPKVIPQPHRYNVGSTVTTTTHREEFEVLIHPHITSSMSLGNAGILTPPPSQSDPKFAFDLGVPKSERRVNRAPYDLQSPFTSSLDTLAKLEAELDG